MVKKTLKEIAKSQTSASAPPNSTLQTPTTETGGPKGLEPTRYGDWEINGKCVDF